MLLFRYRVEVAEPYRPSPEALLKQAAQEARGRLKVLLGAAPGVGKTFEMLLEGAARLKAGEDVVIGLVETHGRPETAALIAPFEIIPRRLIDHGGHMLDEMDLDALLARRPGVALVDELAHTNASGSRHPKRWQDIEELRDAGIDVVTTVNIQHLESLNDVVASFTHVRVKETVPDHVLEDADIEVVDLPADELIARLKAGKVYKPGEAERALGNFFGKSNLQALRELALRRAAQVVDRQMIDLVDATGMPAQWNAGERLLVAVADGPGADTVVRAGKRLADAMKAPWTAVVVETPRHASLDAAALARLADAMRLAVTLGGSIATVPAATVVEGLKAHAAETRVTQLVLGKSRRNWWFELRHGSVVDRLVRDLEGVSVHVVPMPTAAASTGLQASAFRLDPRGILLSMGLVGVTVILGLALQPLVGFGAIDLLFLLPVIVAATLFGLRSALVTTLASALAYNFFFLPPIHTFTIADPRNVITLVVLAAVAVIASELAGRLKARATIGTRQARENAALAAFGQRLAGLSTEAETAVAVTDELSQLFGVQSLLLAREGGILRLLSASPPGAKLDAIDEASAGWAFDKGVSAGCFTDTLTASDWQFHPLKTTLGTLAVVGIADTQGANPLPSDRALLFATIVGQAALAWERIHLEADARAVVELRSRDELRSTLLASIGHDLRTPLTTIVATVEQLRAAGPQSADLDLLHRETRRLARFFADLIDMTRVEASALAPKLQPVDLTDAVAAALGDLEAELAEHQVCVSVPVDLPMVNTDPRLLHHMLINLLSNVATYTPPGTSVHIKAEAATDGLLLAVEDNGPGLPEDLVERVFDRFQTGQVSDRTGGTGLGLAIVKGFGQALGIEPTAGNGQKGGARFVLRFPGNLLDRTDMAQA